jgi:LPS export ABC transporter protein LptC
MIIEAACSTSMTIITMNNKKKLKFFLISIIFITFGVVSAVFVGYRHISDKEDKLVSNIQSKANISIGKAHQTATRNGITEWNLDAASVDYINNKNQAIFHDLSVKFFLKDKTNVYIKADRGILNTDSNDMKIFGNVVVENGSYLLKCDNLYYKHNGRIIFSETPVNITGDLFNLVADSMSLDLNTNRSIFEGKVAGTLRERITL